MKPRAVLFLFYGVLLLLATAWLSTGSEWNSLLFYTLFLSSFSFNAYCGFLEFKSGSERIS